MNEGWKKKEKKKRRRRVKEWYQHNTKISSEAQLWLKRAFGIVLPRAINSGYRGILFVQHLLNIYGLPVPVGGTGDCKVSRMVPVL